MKVKHKLLSDYQHLTNDKKIFLIKSGTILNNYTYNIGDEEILIDSDIINGNPGIFSPVDWKQELHSYIKSNKFPQPKTLASKLEPFIESMIITSISSSENKIDESMIKELESKEHDLNRRENRIKEKEEEIELRLNRVDKRENGYKEDLKELDIKEDELRLRSRKLTEKEIDIEERLRELREKERNLDRHILDSSKDLDVKYSEIQNKINLDLKDISEKEKQLEILKNEIKRKSDEIEQKEADLNDQLRDFLLSKEEFEIFKQEVYKLNNEIQNWEKLHWKFKRSVKPPSVEN
jgi:DNA repair exonuclease SbcCD ATPase subunit